MSKLQKILFISFVVLSLIAGFFGYLALKNTKQPTTKALSLIPDSCNVLLTFEDYSSFSSTLRNKNLIWQDIKALSVLNKLEIKFDALDSLIAITENLSELLENNPVYVSLYKNGNYLVAFNIKELGQKDTYTELVTKLSALVFKGGVSQFHDGVVGISDSNGLLARFFDSNNSKLINNAAFAELNKSANYSGTSVYVASGAKSVLENSFGNLTIKPDKIVLNGIAAKQSGFYGDAHSKSISSPSFLQEIPLICNAFETFALDSAEILFKGQKEKDWWEEANENANFNAKKQFYQNINGYLTKVILPSKNSALIVPLLDTGLIKDILPFICDSARVSPFTRKLAYDYRSFSNSTFAALNLNELNYISVFDSYLALTRTSADAEIFTNSFYNNSSILNNKSFSQYASKNFDTEFHYLSYGLVNTLNKENILLGEYLSPEDLVNFKNIGHCSVLGSFKNKQFNFRLNVNYLQENFTDEPNILWTFNTDTTIITKPYLFKNHLTHVNEIAFQTADKALYLQTATGKTIWKKKISESITSGIYTVDAFKNNKFQLLFNTENYIHLIDRNGNYVQGYPVKLPAKACSKLTVLDYENNNDLRLFIACADNKIYNFSIWAMKHEGFKPVQTSSPVVLPIKYCKVGASDYLIAVDVKGKIYAFSRKGDGRIDFKNKLIENAEDFDIVPGNTIANTQIVYFDDKNNLINKISLTDKKEINKTGDADKKTVYAFADFDGNKITDVILASEGNLETYDFNGMKNFGSSLPDKGSADDIGFYSLGGNNYVSLLDKTNSNCMVLSTEQKTTREYKCTLAGTIMDLYNDRKAYLLIVDGKQLKCSKL